MDKPKLALDHWHIEASSRCSLKCSRCPRREVPESLLNKQLTLDFFKNQIGEDIASQIKKITFCGNDGDPSYCTDLIEIIRWLKTCNASMSIVIITNGSYKDEFWWQDLAEVLDHNDEINWSLDGWDQASNEQYRVHCDWNSIETGINTFFANNASTYRVWSAVGFRFNEDNLPYMREFAADWGFDLFQLTKSTKFGFNHPEVYGNDDPLEPHDKSLLTASHKRVDRDLTFFTKKVRPGSELKVLFAKRAEELKDSNYSGLCLIGNKGVFLNSRGEFYPCCWTANRYHHNQQWLDLVVDRFNLNKRTFTEILNDKFWSTDFLKFDSFECKLKCTHEKLDDKTHTTEW